MLLEYPLTLLWQISQGNVPIWGLMGDGGVGKSLFWPQENEFEEKQGRGGEGREGFLGSVPARFGSISRFSHAYLKYQLNSDLFQIHMQIMSFISHEVMTNNRSRPTLAAWKFPSLLSVGLSLPAQRFRQ